ncbi:MAG: T9SS type A sorting domain-containing protein [Chitinophagaceae bacterium]|nr:T9SS type A sorting domain-containing protein [Chitinophagaceae bacterium]
MIQWQTTDEVNTSSFSIEHSNNGREFTSVGNVAAANMPGVHKYQFTHAGISEGDHYYRLKMADIDGSYTYSVIKLVKVSAGISLQAYPNPARQFVTVRGLQGDGTLELISIDGKTVYRTTTVNTSTTINLNNITNGTYIIRYIYRGQVEQLKIIKQ